MTAADEYTNLSEHAQLAADHVCRHWLATPDVVRRVICPTLSLDAARKFLARLVERGWLVRHVLPEGEPYFVLGSKAVAAFGLRRSTRALGIQALLEHYAVLLACTRRGCGVITEDEFRAEFPDLCEPGQSVKNFFVDETVVPFRLGLFVVDHDKRSSRLVQKVRQRIGRMMDTDRPALRQLVLNGGLSVSVLTATEGKRANLAAAFARKPLRSVAVTVEAHPELESLFLVNRR
jgi:hypothetical protein